MPFGTGGKATHRRWLFSLTAVLLQVFLIGLAIGMSMPLTALNMERWGTAAWAIGLVAAAPAGAIIVIMPLVPLIARHIGAFPSLVLGCLVGAGLLLAMPFLPNVWLWGGLRFLMGAAFAMPWLICETWINSLAQQSNRGRVLAFYGIAFFGGVALAPWILSKSGTVGWQPFALAAGIVLVSLLPLLPLRARLPEMALRPRLRLWVVLRLAPAMAVCAVLAGATEFSLFSLLPLHALRSGYEQTAALELLTVLMLGAVVLQYPIGRLADFGGRRALLLGLGGLTLISLLLLHLFIGSFGAAAVAVFFLGGTALAYYVVGLAFLADSFEPADWPVANAVFIMLYETASLSGPVFAGLAMDFLPRQGLLLFVAGVTLALLLPLAFGAMRRPPAKDAGLMGKAAGPAQEQSGKSP